MRLPERFNGKNMNNRLYKICKKMPKNEALALLDTYKDHMKSKDKLGRKDIKCINEILGTMGLSRLRVKNPRPKPKNY